MSGTSVSPQKSLSFNLEVSFAHNQVSLIGFDFVSIVLKCHENSIRVEECVKAFHFVVHIEAVV